MAATRANPRLQVGSATWIANERSTAFQVVESEAEEFTFSARNEIDWLNEHMTDIFSENQVNVAEIFKTPGKLRGKTPRTARKINPLGGRAPLSDVFSATPRARPSPLRHIHFEKPVSTFKVAEDGPQLPEPQVQPPKQDTDSTVIKEQAPSYAADSGYFGSQSQSQSQWNETTQTIDAAQPNEPIHICAPPEAPSSVTNTVPLLAQSDAIISRESDRRTASFQSAKEEQTRNLPEEETLKPNPVTKETPSQKLEPTLQKQPEKIPSSPMQSPQRPASPIELPSKIAQAEEVVVREDEHVEEISDGSSPIRPIVRKSSLNFASLPAREPITTKKSIGTRFSRVSHLEPTRTSYYGRSTGDKSLGNIKSDAQHSVNDDGTVLDETVHGSADGSQMLRLHNKTSTQRLQDQISMLGKPQSSVRPPSKSITNSGPFAAPGAFPDDDEDSWIGAPAAGPTERLAFSPRPQVAKSRSIDVVEETSKKDRMEEEQLKIAKRGDSQLQMSPRREPFAAEKNTSTLGHMKSASTSVLRSPNKGNELLESRKLVAVSNPNPSIDTAIMTPQRSPARSQRGSPLKAAKDKFSSLLKTSRGLFASSAAVSAEAKTAAMSPASRMGFNSQPSFEEERRKDNEARVASQKMTSQLEDARQKVKEESRIYHLEQEKVAATEKDAATRKEEEKPTKAEPASVPRATRSSPRRTKAQLEAEEIAAAASTKQPTTKDVEMPDAPALPPPSAVQDIPRPKSQIGRPTAKRPLKPAKEPLTKAKPPTVIRVDTSSQRGHQYHPSNATLAATLHESLAAPTPGYTQGLRSKAGANSIQRKASTGAVRSAATRAIEAAARKKEQDDLAAQRKREAKQEFERQRAANREEDRRKEEQAARQEAERLRVAQQYREDATKPTNTKPTASRQALQAIEKRRLEVEKAKMTSAPPPAIRPQQNMDLNLDMLQDKALPQQRGDVVQAQSSRPQSTVYRPHEEHNRPVNSVLHSTTKVPPKRPLPQDATDDNYSRPAAPRNAPSHQNDGHQPKRRRTSEKFDGHSDGIAESQPKMTAPPIRQSSIRQKDIPTKSIFPSGYGNAPQPASLQRATLIAQHNQSKPAHPMDMAQISKTPIPFATNSSHGNAQHKTPARPGQAPQGAKGKSTAKSAAKSSPRYQNGDSIELPEINTDSEDDDSDAGEDFVALSWTNSPDLRKQLAKQETVDPAEVFGQPGPLNMEEVFSKSKDRFPKFRARTSSANWSGTDRLTEDEVRRDLEARDRVRRQGGWTYDSMV